MASRGDIGQARKKLDASALPTDEKNLIEAEFEGQWGDSTIAAVDFRKSTSAAPGKLRTWLEWSGMNLRNRDFTDAFNIANEGLKLIPSNSVLMAMKDRAQALAGAQLDSDSQDLLNALSIDPTNEAGIATLAALTGSETPGDAINKLQTVAEKYPRFLPVESIIIRKYFRAGLLDQAVGRATRTCAMLPIEAEPAQLLAGIYATAHQWDRALAAAQEWRSRSLDHPHPADIAIASAEIGLQQPERAESQLAWCLKDPPSDSCATDVYARALCREGRVDQAWNIFQPYSVQPARRQRWLKIVSTDAMDPNVASRYIQQISPQCQADSINDQLSLAEAWFAVGTQMNDPGDMEKARSIVQPIAAKFAKSPKAWILLGDIQQQQNNLSSAENSFSTAIKIAPQLAIAKNDLAMVMLLGNEDLNTAKKFATAAVSQTPAESAFHSTLGEIDMQMNDLESAKSQFQIALRLNVENAEALIGTAAIEDRAGDTGVAGILNQAQSLLSSSHQILPVRIREEFQTLQRKYSARKAPFSGF
jgi:tetratricopeptide (TPR) repeat protein